MAHLKLSDVCVNFGGLQALSNVSFKLQSGEILALIGPNGAGKTTVFNVITGVYKVASGSVQYDDTTLTGLRPPPDPGGRYCQNIPEHPVVHRHDRIGKRHGGPTLSQ